MYLFKPRPGEQHPGHSYYRKLYPKIIQDIQTIEANWRMGRHNLQRINCRSENSKGVYCLQYDDQVSVSFVIIKSTLYQVNHFPYEFWLMSDDFYQLGQGLYPTKGKKKNISINPLLCNPYFIYYSGYCQIVLFSFVRACA